MILTIAGVAIVALVAFGVMTQEQGDNAQGTMSNLASTIEGGMNDVMESTEELAQDAEAQADAAYQAAVEEMNTMNEDAIEPAAGDAEEMMNDMQDKMSN